MNKEEFIRTIYNKKYVDKIVKKFKLLVVWKINYQENKKIMSFKWLKKFMDKSNC